MIINFCLPKWYFSFGGAESDCFIMKSAGELPAVKVFTVLVAQSALLCERRSDGFRTMPGCGMTLASRQCS